MFCDFKITSLLHYVGKMERLNCNEVPWLDNSFIGTYKFRSDVHIVRTIRNYLLACKLTSNRFQITFLRGANFGGSKITTSHDSFLAAAPFMNSVASSLKNEILPGSNLLSWMFSFASSKAGDDESIPENKQINIVKLIFYLRSNFSSNMWHYIQTNEY